MNILLDYFFPISASEPTPQASTAFLKQCLVVVKPAAEVTTGVVTACTTLAAAEALTDNEDIAELFAAGMSKVYVLPMDDLDLADALEGFDSDFFTILISSDFTSADIEHTDAAGGVKASKKIGDITFTAVTAGVAGNSIAIILSDDVSAGGEWTHVAAEVITIHMEDGVSTAAQILAALEDSVAAIALVTAAIDVGDEAVAQAAAGSTSLESGADAVGGSAGGMQLGTFAGVVGVVSDDDEFLADQAALSKRVAMHTGGSAGKNMLYAFGKLLSDALDWKNQQFISMPEEDDVATLGDANSLFDAKISFVLSDDQYGQRLGLFAAGGKAIVAPYIERNLEIDLQSKALSYISGNQPQYTRKHAALLEDELKTVIQLYIEREWIEAGTVEVKLENDNFVASGYINIAEPSALWRVFGDLKQTL